MITPSKNTQVFIVRPINNRHDRRQANREAKKFLMELGEIENEFSAALFAEMDYATYVSLYRAYNDLYIKVADFWEKKLKPKYIMVDKLYFCNHYKPEEKT